MKPKAARVLLFIALAFFILAVILITTGLRIGGWDSLLPILLGALAGLIALILSITGSIVAGVNYAKRVSRWTDQQAKSKRIKRDLSILGGIFAMLAVIFMFTYIAPVQTVQKNIDTVHAMVADLPQGYTPESDETGSAIRFCLPTTYCYLDAHMAFKAPGGISHLKLCDDMLAWASRNGGKYISDGFGDLDIVIHPLSAKLACAANSNGASISGDNHGVKWVSYGSNPILLFTVQDQPASGEDTTVESRLNHPDRLFDVLDRIGQWRKNHPGKKETDAAILNAVKGVDGIDSFEVVTDPEGRWLAYELAEGTPYYCVRIAPWDAEYFGMPDPGQGYLPMNDGGLNRFGSFTMDTCVIKDGN